MIRGGALHRRALILALLALPAALVTPAVASAVLPPIHHVYVIVLENESASTSFGPNSPAPYLAKTLRAQGTYLPNYYGIGHVSLDNYIAMISGQAPNADTSSDCNFYTDFPLDVQGSDGQQQGAGCVYPASVPTLVSQFSAAGLTWRSYNDSMGADPTRETAVCGHPGFNSQDHTQSATATDQYASRHDPFVYFHSIVDDTSLCNTHVVNLDPLPQDLANADGPNYTFITPSLCNDGHDTPCANNQPGGLVQADSFLKTWVPRITASPAYRNDGGLLIVTFDEAATSDTTACCGEIAGPGSPMPGISGPGGGDVGAVVLSPYVKAAHVDNVPYNHYTMLRSVEDLFRLGHIGYANLPGGASFGSDLFACQPAATPIASRGRLPAGSKIERVRVLRRRGRASLSVLSVGNSTLATTVTQRRRRPRTQRRALVPCRTYTVPLPKGHGRVRVSALAGGAAQTQTVSF